MQIDDDSKNKESLIAKGINPRIVAGMSADRRQHLAELLRTKQVHDGGVFVWLMLCFGILVVAALVSALI